MNPLVAEMETQFRARKEELQAFDAHCWLGRSNDLLPVAPGPAEDVIQQMDACGIARALVSHTLARYYYPQVGNERLLEEIKDQDRLEGCFVLLPPVTGELGKLDAYLDTMVGQGIRSVRLFPNSHHYSLSDWSLGPLLNALEERRIPLFIWHRETDWDTLHRLCHAHPHLPVILEQTSEEAYWNARYLYALLDTCENLLVEIANFVLYLGLDALVARFGAQRFIYGSHLPVDDPNAILMLITDGDFTSTDKELIARKNLERVLEGVRS